MGRAMQNVSCADKEGPVQTAQAYQDLHCPLTESLYTPEFMNGEQRPVVFGACAGRPESAYFLHVRRHVFT